VAAPQAQPRAGRYFLALLATLVILYALAFFTGTSHAPKLGLDLKGGTTVTLTAKTDTGAPPSKESLDKARQIISDRVNNTGVQSAEVVTEGDQHIVISAPGEDGEQVKNLAQTALLRFRPVTQVYPITPAAGAPITTTPPSPATSKGTPTTSPSPRGRPVPPALAPTTTPRPPTVPKPTPSVPGDASLYPGATPTQLTMLTALNCDKGAQQTSKPDQPIAACSKDKQFKYLLDKALFEGTEVATATAQGPDQNDARWRVSLELRSTGQTIWSTYTAANVGKQVAFTLDDKVVSAPAIQSAINGATQITGNFDQKSATDLADVLKYGALPLTFTQETAQTISPTLGTDQLKAGLLAGGIGLVLVVLYSLLYYRMLGFVTIASLVVSGLLTYGFLVVLGNQIGFALTLAGVAGFIVAVGITADSFVVFFERLKDEIREGRSARSAVPRAWVRARRTILSADAVSFLAAAILYYLAAGDVKGFAFTLGLSTVLDLVVVFLFTHPLIAVAARSRAFTSPRFSGLGAVRKKTLAPAGAASR